MWIAVDAMGGDHAPEEIVKGAVAFARANNSTGVFLAGPTDVLKEQLARCNAEEGLVTIVDAPEVVEMDDPPTASLRRKPRSSVSVATDLVRDGKAAAVVSVGNTGAFMAKALVSLGTVPGVDRPAIAVVMPSVTGSLVLIDAGANVDCHVDMLVQFAVMGSIYASALLGIQSPKVALLNIGSEYIKGDKKSKQAHELLRAADINFTGNIEGNRMFSGEADVIVCDGFVGNVALKAIEGASRLIVTSLRDELESSLTGKLGAWILRRQLRRLHNKADYSTYGGALLVGLNGVCVAGHGRSTSRAVTNALHVARTAVERDVVKRICRSCAEIGLGVPSSTNQQRG